MKVRKLIKVLLLLASVLVGGCEMKLRSQPDSSNSDFCVASSDLCQVPIAYLYSDGRVKLEGHLIAVRGYYVANGRLELYPDQESALHRIKERAIQLEATSAITDLKLDANSYVDVVGRFTVKNTSGNWATIKLISAPQAIPESADNLPPAPPRPE